LFRDGSAVTTYNLHFRCDPLFLETVSGKQTVTGIGQEKQVVNVINTKKLNIQEKNPQFFRLTQKDFPVPGIPDHLEEEVVKFS